VSIILIGCSRKSDVKNGNNQRYWPPRTHENDQRAAGIPIYENIRLEIIDNDPISFHGFMIPEDGIWVPMIVFLDMEGTLSSEIGDIKESAGFCGEEIIYKDSQKDRVIAWAPILGTGKVLVPNIFSNLEAPDIYIENRFYAEDYGERFTLISFDTGWNKLAVLPQEDRNFLITAACPGTKIRFGDKLYERRSDGWYTEGKIISKNKCSAPILVEPPENASEFRISKFNKSIGNLFPQNINIETKSTNIFVKGFIIGTEGGGIVKSYGNEIWVYGNIVRSITTCKMSGKASVFIDVKFPAMR